MSTIRRKSFCQSVKGMVNLHALPRLHAVANRNDNVEVVVLDPTPDRPCAPVLN